MTKIARLENVLLTLWVGSVWAIGYIAAPVLFKLAGDRTLAGSLAGEMFGIVGLVGLVCGGVLLALLGRRIDGFALKKQWRFWAILFMVILVAIGYFGLQPMMAELKAHGLMEGSEQAKQFGMLHGISSSLYLLTSIIGLILVASGLQKPALSSEAT